MKKINDERLQLRNLKNIRIVYIVQTLGIIGILGYDFVTKGMDGMTANPLWFVFLITTVVSAYLSMNISVEHESEEKSPNKDLTVSLSVWAIISIVVGVLVTLSEGSNLRDGVVIGSILLVCGIIPFYYTYRLRKKNQDDNDEK